MHLIQNAIFTFPAVSAHSGSSPVLEVIRRHYIDVGTSSTISRIRITPKMTYRTCASLVQCRFISLAVSSTFCSIPQHRRLEDNFIFFRNMGDYLGDVIFKWRSSWEIGRYWYVSWSENHPNPAISNLLISNALPYLPDTLCTTDMISRYILSTINCTGLCGYISVRTFPFYSPFPLLHDHWHMLIHYIIAPSPWALYLLDTAS